MPRISDAPARDPATAGRAHYCGVRDHNRLRKIRADHGWQIIRLSAVESRCPGIDCGRWRRKPGGQSASGEADELSPYFTAEHTEDTEKTRSIRLVSVNSVTSVVNSFDLARAATCGS